MTSAAVLHRKKPAVAGGVFCSYTKVAGELLGDILCPCAAPGKVCPLSRPQVVGIAPSGFPIPEGRWADAEQSTSPKIGLRRDVRRC
jgi:hypothetical protein